MLALPSAYVRSCMEEQLCVWNTAVSVGSDGPGCWLLKHVLLLNKRKGWSGGKRPRRNHCSTLPPPHPGLIRQHSSQRIQWRWIDRKCYRSHHMWPARLIQLKFHPRENAEIAYWSWNSHNDPVNRQIISRFKHYDEFLAKNSMLVSLPSHPLPSFAC